MKPESPGHPAPAGYEAPAELQGQIEGIKYVNEDTGFTVARVRVPGFLEAVTIVGRLLALAPGEVLDMKGAWESHPRFGRQFRVLSHRTKYPATVRGIKKYLGSGLIKGIGPVMASRIVEKFKERTLDIIDASIGELSSVEGIGRKRVEMIRRAWEEQKEIRAVMIFLQEQGVGMAHAAKIYKQYGQRSIAMISQDPYRLATDIPGVGFRTADRIATNLGFEKNAPIRAEAGILYVLGRLSEEGHVYYPYEPLIDKCRDILDVERDLVIRALGSLALDGKVAVEDLPRRLEGFEPNHKAVYPVALHTTETGIARHVRRLIGSKKTVRRMDPEKAVLWAQKRMKLKLAPRQLAAVKKAVSEKVLIITGGPGTGKTTIIHAVLLIYRAVGARICLAAPTGRAAKRMTEATGHKARTIHRTLEFSWQRGGFQRNEKRPMEADVIIVDEGSMADTVLMYQLLKAIPSGATFILVGDSNQLPSVGPGDVLRDCIRSGRVPVIELTEVFRQAKQSLIVVNAHRINRGLLPETESPGKGPGDFYFVEQEDQERAVGLVTELVCDRIPSRFHMDPMKDIQVLSPMHKGTLGTVNLNARLQELLNPSRVEIIKGERHFRLNDRVMQTRNNYEKEVFNGDMGLIQSIDQEKRVVVVNYDGWSVPYDYPELDEVVLAYAISVHKSQGSEYDAVVLPLVLQHYMMLQRNLIYTAITRGKRLVVIVGSKKALAMGVRNEKTGRRYTYLAERLKGL